MNPAPNDLFLAVTTADGSVYTTTRQASNGTWSPFSKVSNLTQVGRKNVSVNVTFDRQVCAINDAAVRQLRYTKDLTGTTPPVLVRTGVAPVSAEIGSGGVSLAALGIGPRTVPGWTFGLPLSLVRTDQTVIAAGDELVHFDFGELSPSDPAVALDISGTFSDTASSYHLLIATAAGEIYHALKDNTSRPRFQSITQGTLGQDTSPSCSSGREGLHACWVNAGRIKHRIRSTNGKWSLLGDERVDITSVTGSPQSFTRVATAYFNRPGSRDGILHLVAISQSGGLFYANRSADHTADPLWTPFLDVKSMAGDKGIVTSVDIAVQP